MMKLWTPEISWHGKLRVLGLDLHPKPVQGGESTIWKLATAGDDNDVKIWNVAVPGRSLEFRASLNRHTNAVNAVRFSPNGETLASGSDDCGIIIWKHSDDKPTQKQTLSEDDELNKENWVVFKVLRGHTVGVFDLSWSPDSNFILSGSVDNKAIAWDIKKGKPLSVFSESDNYVQGVAWDPKGQYLVTLNNDRSCRIYSFQSKRQIHHISKCDIGRGKFNLKPFRMFLEESSLQSFFRRLAFSPDGSLLIVPSGRLEREGSTVNATFVFSRASLGKPAAFLPSPEKPTVAVRCCPVLFQLRHKASNNDCKTLFKLPYRMVFAVATLDTVLLYDTQQTLPIAMIGKIHYASLTDLTWSTNGQLLVASSSDGYCSLVEFEEGELGTPLTTEELQQLDHSSMENASVSVSGGGSQASHQLVATAMDKPIDVETRAQTTAHVCPMGGTATSTTVGMSIPQDDRVKPALVDLTKATGGVTLVKLQAAPLPNQQATRVGIRPISMVTLVPSTGTISQSQLPGHSPLTAANEHHVFEIASSIIASSSNTAALQPLTTLSTKDNTTRSPSGTVSTNSSKIGQAAANEGPQTPNAQKLVNTSNTTPQSGGQLKPRRLPLSALKSV